MKVCHLTSVHPAEDIRILIKECQSLHKAGHEVTLVVANEESRNYNGVGIVGVKSVTHNPISRIMKTPNKVYKEALRQDADVYHFHDPELLPIGLLLKQKGKKVIYDVHEDVPEQVLSKQWIPKILRRLISNMVEKVERFCSKRFDAIVTATPTINARFEKYNNNSVIVHNFPILNELIGEEVANNSHDKSENHAIYIGGITALRGIKEMIEAIDHVNQTFDSKLLLAGKFAPETLKQESERLDGWRYVDHLGWLSRDEVKNYLLQSKVGLVVLHPEPRYVVSYPIKLFEYMSAGLPVVASDFPLWKSIVETEHCGKCVDPLNPKEIAEAIKWFIANPEQARQMGENGRKAIEEKYNWEKESETLVSLYKTI